MPGHSHRRCPKCAATRPHRTHLVTLDGRQVYRTRCIGCGTESDRPVAAEPAALPLDEPVYGRAAADLGAALRALVADGGRA